MQDVTVVRLGRRSPRDRTTPNPFYLLDGSDSGKRRLLNPFVSWVITACSRVCQFQALTTTTRSLWAVTKSWGSPPRRPDQPSNAKLSTTSIPCDLHLCISCILHFFRQNGYVHCASNKSHIKHWQTPLVPALGSFLKKKLFFRNEEKISQNTIDPCSLQCNSKVMKCCENRFKLLKPLLKLPMFTSQFEKFQTASVKIWPEGISKLECMNYMEALVQFWL